MERMIPAYWKGLVGNASRRVQFSRNPHTKMFVRMAHIRAKYRANEIKNATDQD